MITKKDIYEHIVKARWWITIKEKNADKTSTSDFIEMAIIELEKARDLITERHREQGDAILRYLNEKESK